MPSFTPTAPNPSAPNPSATNPSATNVSAANSSRPTSRLRRIGLTLAAIVTVGGSAFAAAPAAQADVATAGYLCVDGGPPRGAGCFNPDGDHVRVHDLESDGWRIEVRTVTDYGREDVCAIPQGQDTTHCNYNMAEGRTVQVNVVAVNTVNNDRELIAQDSFEI